MQGALFSEWGLAPLDSRTAEGIAEAREVSSTEELLSATSASLVHSALATRTGSPLALAFVLSEVLARTLPAHAPPPRILALPRVAPPIATWTSHGGEGLQLTSDTHASVNEALRLTAAAAIPAGGPLTPEEDHGRPVSSLASLEKRILVAVCTGDDDQVLLVDPSASGRPTRLTPSDELRTALLHSHPHEAEAPPLRAEYDAPSPTSAAAGPFEVPASALLDARGAMELQLMQLVDLYHAAGTPQASRMHHRCADLLAEMLRSAAEHEKETE